MTKRFDFFDSSQLSWRDFNRGIQTIWSQQSSKKIKKMPHFDHFHHPGEIDPCVRSSLWTANRSSLSKTPCLWKIPRISIWFAPTERVQCQFVGHCVTNSQRTLLAQYWSYLLTHYLFLPLRLLGTLDVEFRHEGHHEKTNSHLTNDTTLYDILYRTSPLIRIRINFQKNWTVSQKDKKRLD